MQVGKAEDVLPKLLEELLGELERVFVVFLEETRLGGRMKKPSLISFLLVGKKTVLFFFFCNFCSDGKRVGMKRLCHIGNQFVIKQPIFHQQTRTVGW